MKSSSPPPSVEYEKIPLLREAIEVLVGELSALSGHNAEYLPELKKKKVVVASRLSQVDWTHGPFELDAFDLNTLKSLVTELEAHSRQKIQGHLEFIGRQLLVLQDEHQYWRECMNVSFRKFCDSIPSP